MSLLIRAAFACPVCTAGNEAEGAASVSADRRPDLREAILDGSFQQFACRACGAPIRLQPRFTYMDIARGQWIVAHAAADLPDWRILEDEARVVFAHSYGEAAPRAARRIGAGLRARMVFGWPAVREKLLCGVFGLDDVTLELTKLAVLRDVPGAPFGDAAELRLDGMEDADLVLQWSSVDNEASLTRLRLPRTVYDEIATDADVWAEPRDEFSARPFVDLTRLLVV
jgi:hypothetical protein